MIDRIAFALLAVILRFHTSLARKPTEVRLSATASLYLDSLWFQFRCCNRTFHDEFAGRGLVVIGMYTPKPHPRDVTLPEARGYVKTYGFTFPVAVVTPKSSQRG